MDDGRGLIPGDHAPWFVARTSVNPRYRFDSVAGRYLVLCFFGSAGDASSAAVLEAFGAQTRFDDVDASFFGVSEDPRDEHEHRVADRYPGFRYFWDFKAEIRKAYGLTGADSQLGRATFVLDPALRVVACVPFGSSARGHVDAVMRILDALPSVGTVEGPGAPVLVVPAVFEPELCRRLIGYFELRGGKSSGFMTEREGVTVERMDQEFKRRHDCLVEDEALRDACAERIRRRLVPLIGRAFQFKPTRMERHLVACYYGAEKGNFRAHRDDTTKGTAHRRFAVSLFLNTGEYQGGELRFPEFGSRRYSAPAGGAVAFSCSLLHEALPVLEGRRYMFLPFLYDEAAARVRERNARFLESQGRDYKALRK
jgi:peroxiredoxin/predicted 2-oxoglutarate/Fe(II)-dependent dioxygenase YbiX